MEERKKERRNEAKVRKKGREEFKKKRKEEKEGKGRKRDLSLFGNEEYFVGDQFCSRLMNCFFLVFAKCRTKKGKYEKSFSSLFYSKIK